MLRPPGCQSIRLSGRAALHYVASLKRFKFNARPLWHQLKIYCIYKSIYYASQRQRDLHGSRGVGHKDTSRGIAVAASHQKCLRVLVYAAAAIFQSALSFQCPLTISIWRQLLQPPTFAPALATCSCPCPCHDHAPSEPQLLTN